MEIDKEKNKKIYQFKEIEEKKKNPKQNSKKYGIKNSQKSHECHTTYIRIFRDSSIIILHSPPDLLISRENTPPEDYTEPLC